MLENLEKTVGFVITKATLGTDGVMRWNATVSKFSPDDQKDEVTKEFYEHAIEHVEKGDYPMPALVVSHYDDPRLESVGKPVPDSFVAGDTTEMYIERNHPKAKGIFRDNSVGKALFKTVREDISNKVPAEQSVRISMAFRPSNDGIEKSENGIIKYTNGHIRHFAATRVPIVKETELTTIEKSEARKTRYEDAATIVGPEIAAELDKNYKELIMTTKSDAEDNGLIEKADDAAMKYHKDGKFDMGMCISEMTGEGGKPRKQAIAVCLDMSRGKKKSETDSDELPMSAQLFDHGLCVKQYVSKSWSDSAAASFCDSQLIKMMMNSDDYEEDMEEGKSKKTKKTAMTTEKGDLNTFMDKVISDDTMKVVTNGTDTVTESKSEESVEAKSEESVNQKSEAEPVSEKTEEAMTTGESKTEVNEAEKGVNVTEKSVAEPSDTVVEMINIFKAALSSPNMDRTERTAVVNSVLQNLGQYAEERIQQIPPTVNDQAESFKAALSEVVGPLTDEVQKLRADNERMKMAMKGGFVDEVFRESKVTPRQLTAQPVQKSGITGDNGGALTSKQIAESTIRQIR